MAHSSQQNPQIDLIHEAVEQPTLVQRWYALTARADTPLGIESTFVQREAVRRSRLSSSVIFFFLLLIVGLLPVTALVIGIYPSYFWLTLGLFAICVLALIVNRQGSTNSAGIIVTLGSFAILTAAFFSTVPFDETTLQGYDMYAVLLVLSVSLLPARTVFFFYVLSVGAIISTLLLMPLTPTLQADVHSRLVLILVRPMGTLFMVGVFAYITATSLTTAIRRANRAETIAKLEHEQAQLRHDLEKGIEQILQTHIAVSNGNLSARAPLAQDHILWQIARSLNTLLIRFQRAVQAEQQLQSVDQVVTRLVALLQQAKQQRTAVHLPMTTNPHLDPLIAELQGETITMPRPSALPTIPTTPEDRKPPLWS